MELVERAFAALDVKLDIIESSEQQLEKLKHEYTELLQKLEITDPNESDGSKCINDLTKWLVVSIGKILAFIFKNKEFNMVYIGKYKDQTAYSYFDSEFIGSVLFYKPKSKQKPAIVFLLLYSNGISRNS